MRRSIVCLTGFLACAGLVCASPGRAAGTAGSPESIADIVSNVQDSVMRIIVVHPADKPAPDEAKMAQAAQTAPVTRIGSGFVIDPSGLVATNRHVAENSLAIFVATPDGGRYRAEIVGMPVKADIALLRIHPGKPLPAVTFGDSDDLRPGDTVIAIGSPFGFDNTVTAGIVSSTNRDIMETPFDDYIQTDAAINHGNSGGPLFNMKGEVVGMNSILFAPGTYSGSIGLGFAIPANDLRFVFQRLKQYGQVRAGMLPIRTQQVTALMAQAIGAPGPGGALVAALEQKSEMMNGQIQPGDVIETFNGEKVWDPRDLARKAAKADIGSKAHFTLSRGGAMTAAEVTILPYEDEPSTGQTPGPPPKTLGLQFKTAAVEGSETAGASVVSIDPSGSAADSGLQAGDVILRVQKERVTTAEQAEAALHARASARQDYAAVLVERDGKRTWVPVALPQ